MEKDSFLEFNHPVEKYLGCSDLLKHYKHQDFPGLNTAIEELIGDEVPPELASKTYGPPLLNIGRPIPCLSPEHVEEQDNPKEDQTVELVRKKYLWKRKKKKMQLTVNRLTTRPVLYPELMLTVEGEAPITRLPYAVVRMTDHLANNPDKYFKGSYHWYYGNVMEKITIKNDRYLLHAGGKNLNELSMTLLEKPRNSAEIPTLTPQVSLSMAEPSFIYDIVANNNVGAVGVRQRNACSFLNYYEVKDGSFSFRNFSTVKSAEYPFVAMDNSHSEFCTIDANRTVQFWRPADSTDCIEHIILPKNDEKLVDRFAQIKYDSDYSQTVVIVDRRNVYIYDKRENLAEPCSRFEPGKQTELCEEISLIVPSVQEKNWYVGMSHSCLLLDHRMGFVEKWMHMLSQPPSVGRTFRIKNEPLTLNEAVILSTQSTNETVAIYHTSKEPRVTFSPARLSSRLDTLNQAQINGVLTNNHLQHKFRYSIIGLVPYRMKKRAGILSLISTGDIFHQYARPNDGVFDKNATELSEEELQYLEDWEEKFRTKNLSQKQCLTVDYSVDFSKLVNSIDESMQIPPWETRAVPRKQHWKIPVKSLYGFRDLLVPFLLNDYGVDDLEESSDECEHDPLSDNNDKVGDWLSGNYGQRADPVPHFENDTDVFIPQDASTAETVTELGVVIPPEFDIELSKRKRKRQGR